MDVVEKSMSEVLKFSKFYRDGINKIGNWIFEIWKINFESLV